MRVGGGMGGMWHRGQEDLGDAKLSRTTARRAWRFSHRHHRRIFLYLGAITVGAILALVPALVFREIIDEAIPRESWGLAARAAGLAVLVAVAATVLDLGQRYWSAVIGEGLIFDLRVALYEHVQGMPIAFFTRTQTGALMSRMNNDVIGAQRALTGTLGQVVFNALTVLTTVGAMLALDWRLTLLALLILPLFVFPAQRVGRRLQEITRQSMERNASLSALMSERLNVSGALLVKLFGDHRHEQADFSQRAGDVRDIGIRSALYGRIFFAGLSLASAVGVAVVYLVGARQAISGALSVGTLVAMATYVNRVYQPLTALTNARIDVLIAFVSFERVFELLDTPRSIEDHPGAVDLVDPQGLVELHDVHFRYPAASDVSVASLEGQGRSDVVLDPRVGVEVLHGIDLVARPGTLVALVGPSGAGKSTLVSLIPRLYDVSAGEVTIDGHDVRRLTQASLRAAIGVVNQDPHLFHDSVASNLRYARPDATDEELIEACRGAQIHHVIAALPDGYDTVVGERGYRLSGGEKQRVAIARVLLKDPAIVILDEATSHLDAENEVLVQQALSVTLKGRTSIVIAHRLSTIQAADEILVIDDGRIIERGTHLELLDASGLYSDLYHTFARDTVA